MLQNAGEVAKVVEGRKTGKTESFYILSRILTQTQNENFVRDKLRVGGDLGAIILGKSSWVKPKAKLKCQWTGARRPRRSNLKKNRGGPRMNAGYLQQELGSF